MARHQPAIGVALGSGSARGWAHIGVLRALCDLGVRPMAVAGCSVGAMVGAAWAARLLDPLEDWTRSLTRRDVFGLLDLSFGGSLIKGERLQQLFGRFAHLRIETLPRPFAAVATSLDTGREIVFDRGPLIDAVRASMSMPGLLPPVRIDGTWTLDGALVDPIPVTVCRRLGATRVIAVNLNRDIVAAPSSRDLAARPDEPPQQDAPIDDPSPTWDALEELKKRLTPTALTVPPEERPPGLYEVLVGSLHILQDRVARVSLEQQSPDLELRPSLSTLGLLDVHRADEAIAEGRRVVEEAEGEIRRLLEG